MMQAAPEPAVVMATARELSGSEKVILKIVAGKSEHPEEDTFELRALKAFGLVEKHPTVAHALRVTARGQAVAAELSLSGMDAVTGLIMAGFNRSIQREIAEEDEVRAEIKAKGTYWAGSEIYKLRKALAARKAARP